MKMVIVAAALALLPQPRNYVDSKDVVWGRVVAFIAAHNMTIKAIEKDSGVIVAEITSGPPRLGQNPEWADCGLMFMTHPVGETTTVNVFVRPAAGGSQVAVTTQSTERRQSLDEPIATKICTSNGRLENLILSAADGA